MSGTYRITMEQEVLDEMGANIIASFCSYMDKYNLSFDDKTSITVMSKSIANRKHDIMKCKTLEELYFVKGQFEFAQNCLKEL